MARWCVLVGVHGACMNIHAFGCGGVGGAKVGKRRVLSLSASLPIEGQSLSDVCKILGPLLPLYSLENPLNRGLGLPIPLTV